MNTNRRSVLFALLASPLAIAAAHAAPDAGRNTPAIPDIPDDVSGGTTRRRHAESHHAENHDESHHGRDRHHSHSRSRRHRDGDDD